MKNSLKSLLVSTVCVACVLGCGTGKTGKTDVQPNALTMFQKVEGKDTMWLHYHTVGCFHNEETHFAVYSENNKSRISQYSGTENELTLLGSENLSDSAINALMMLELAGRKLNTKAICTSQYFWEMVLNEDTLKFEVLDCSPFPWYNNFVKQLFNNVEE